MLLIKDCEILNCNDNNSWTTVKGDIVVENGQILHVGDVPGNPTAQKIIDGRGKVAMPGLINAHTHSYANILRAKGENYPLEMWMYYAFLAGLLDEEDVYISAMLGNIEMIRSGVTSCIDHLSCDRDGLEAALKAYVNSGMRVTMSPMVSDKVYHETIPVDDGDIPEEIVREMIRKEPKTADYLMDLCIELIEKWHNSNNGRISIFPGPSGPQRCSEKLLVGLAGIAGKYDLGIHTHLVETKVQAITAHRFYGCTMAEYLDNLGILNNRWSMAHSVWVSDSDIELLADRGVKVSHNPASNLTIGSGISPVNKFVDAGVKVALGTDGSNCSGSQNMFRIMSLAAMLTKITTPDFEDWRKAGEILAMATKGGAQALLMEAELGALEPGRKADIVLLDSDSPSLAPRIDLIYQLVYAETGSAVDTVIIDGDVVMEGRQIKTFNEEEILKEAHERFSRFEEKMLPAVSEFQRYMPYIERIYRREIGSSVGFHRTGAWE
jgi:cytosine/adenosine deaminase-related metal-dependent hydrolase